VGAIRAAEGNGRRKGDAFAEVFDNVHPVSKLVATGGMMDMKINFYVSGSFIAAIEGLSLQPQTRICFTK
jgi:hypothetical protein